MNSTTRSMIGLVFKCLAAIALIFAFVFFMRMQEEQSRIANYRNAGTVSRALVTEKKRDTMVYEGRKGRSRSTDIQVLHVRFDPQSKVRYADYPAKVPDARLPAAPALTGDPMADSKFDEIIWVPEALYARTEVGDMLTVVDAPFSGFGPELVSDIRDFDPSIYYPRMVIALVLMQVFAVLGWRIGRKPA